MRTAREMKYFLAKLNNDYKGAGVAVVLPTVAIHGEEVEFSAPSTPQGLAALKAAVEEYQRFTMPDLDSTLSIPATITTVPKWPA